jgi:hypothetical protein
VAWVGRLYEGRAHRPVNKRINCRWVRIIGGCQRPAGHAGPVNISTLMRVLISPDCTVSKHATARGPIWRLVRGAKWRQQRAEAEVAQSLLQQAQNPGGLARPKELLSLRSAGRGGARANRLFRRLRSWR